MGLLSLVFDTVVISSSFAGLRRATGFNIGAMVSPRIANETARKVSVGFFNVGEWVVDRGMHMYKTKVSPEAQEQAASKIKEIADKTTSKVKGSGKKDD
eukprot:TRINITY_DN2144_c0_g1_i3.p1 TRINITY_DN2144_c0_g1~~TRINITY_DN2144_c0_g1_i3.p1  ORF type:complete len:106 (-),score=22.96 TRINITY_DN2144_c0_g1_i3:73-369(-)